MKIVEYLLGILAVNIVFTCLAQAAPTRTFSSTELFKAYQDISLFDFNYQDKFYVTSSDASATYSLNYSSDDPIVAISLRGGQITKFERINNGAGAVIQFTVPQTTGLQIEVTLGMLTKSIVHDESLFKDENFYGAWFSTLGSDPSLDPFISTQLYDGIYLSYKLTSGVTPFNDTLSFFLPNTALKEINRDKDLPVKNIKLRLATTTKGSFNYFDTVESVQDGAIGKINYKFTDKPELVQLSVSPFGKTGLYGIDSVAKNTVFGLTAIVKDCKRQKKVEVYRQTNGQPPVLFKNAPMQQCQANVTTKINSKTTFFFKVGSKIYKKTVKISKAN